MGAVPQRAQMVASGGRERLGRVVANSGREILAMIDTDEHVRQSTRVGDVVVIGVGSQATVGFVSGMNEPAPGLDGGTADLWMAQIELVGTLGLTLNVPTFTRSVAVPPTLGEYVYKATATDLRRLFRNGDETAYPIGAVLGKDEVAATIDGERLVDGGFAILGGAGSGRSCTLASLVRAMLRHRHAASIVLVDTYNEYSRSFGKAAVTISPEPGLIPHWILSFTELQWVLSRSGGALDADERSLLEEAIPIARKRFRTRNARQSEPGDDQFVATVETPLPYRMFDVIGVLEKISDSTTDNPHPAYRRLRTRIMAAVADPRFALFFGDTAPSDTLALLLRRLFRLDLNAAPMAVLQVGQLCSGVDRLVVSVVCRLASALAEWGAGRRRTLLLIEDIGRYAPSDPADDAAQLSLEALRALGGRPRKLGTTLGMVSGDARHIHRDIMAQCATFFVHRLTSHTEIEAIYDLLPEAPEALLGSVATLGVGETLGLGQGVPLAGRLAVAPLPEAAVPTEHRDGREADHPGSIDALVRRWREQGVGEWTALPPMTM